MADDDEAGEEWDDLNQSEVTPTKAQSTPEKGGSGRGRGGGRGRGAKEPKRPCICCEEVRVHNTRFCLLHKRSFDNMRYQMQSQKDEALALVFEEKMKIDSHAKAQVLDFTQLNPPDKRYARKQLLDWTAFKRVHGVRMTHKEDAKEKPFTEAAFKIWAVSKQGVCEEEAKKEWDKHYHDPKVDRDQLGLGGALRLYIPGFLSRSWGRETYTDNQQEEGSKPIKDPSDKDRQMFKDHVHRQETSFSDPFMQAKDKTAIHIKRQMEVGASGSSQDGAQDGSRAAKRVKKGTFNVDRDAPRLDKAMEADLKRLDKSVEKALASYDKVVAALAAEPVGTVASDRALGSYVKGLGFRRQLLYRFQDDLQTVVSATDLSISSGAGDASKSAGILEESQESKESKAAPASPCSASSALSALSTATSVRSRSVRQLVDENASRKPFQGDAADFRSRSQLEELKAKAYETDSEVAFEELGAEWNRAVKLMEQLIASLQQSVNDTSSHIATKRRDQARAAKSMAAQRQADELKRVREEAKQKADEIKKRHEESKQPTIEPIYFAGLTDLPAVTVLTDDDAQRAWDEPWVIKNSETAQLWSGDVPVQKVLAAWGASYKKDKACAEIGRAQRMMDAGAARESTVKFLQKHCPPDIVDLSAIEGGATFSDSIWLFGSFPGMRFTGLLPNIAATVRLMSFGEVKTLLLELSSLATALGDRASNLAFLQEDVPKFDQAQLQKLHSGGVKMRWLTHARGQVLYIPQGWVSVEHAPASTNTLVYGVRKSYVVRGAASRLNYQTALALYRASGRNTKRMEAIEQLMV